MKPRQSIGIVLVTLVVALAGCTTQKSGAKTSKPVDPTPTFYFHGYGGSANSTNHLIHYAETHDDAHQVYQAVVSATGHVWLKGNWARSTNHPIIQVVFKNSKNADLHTDAKWVRNVLQAVNQEHHFTQYNVVAHSMGNLAFMYYTLFEQQTFKAPTLRKEVNIAGHFDGIISMGDKPNANTLKPSGEPTTLDPRYKEMMAARKHYPKNQVDVLNIFGNKDDGTNSDGSVTNVSSRSLRYLLRGRYKSYTEMMFTGPAAQHSRLHENDAVAKAVGDYLY